MRNAKQNQTNLQLSVVTTVVVTVVWQYRCNTRRTYRCQLIDAMHTLAASGVRSPAGEHSFSHLLTHCLSQSRRLAATTIVLRRVFSPSRSDHHRLGGLGRASDFLPVHDGIDSTIRPLPR